MEQFDAATSPLHIVNLKSPKGRDYMAQAIALFETKYPELLDNTNPDMNEDFSDQKGRRGVMHALVNSSTNEVVGFFGGVVFGQAPRHVSIAPTYIVTKDNDPVLGRRLLEESVASLRRSRREQIDGIFPELTPPGVTKTIIDNGQEKPQILTPDQIARDRAEFDMYVAMGAQRVPVQRHGQPLAADSNDEIKGLVLYAVFPGNPTPAKKSDITYAFMTDIIYFYDPAMANPNNKERLDLARQDLYFEAQNPQWTLRDTGPKPQDPAA